ncbi:ABC transporter permease subunit [Effusibacillus pohliae]|uniref:ABC transporter permease subunit n=1 Tax=Effusibacillus pohliae TaxID=232270 RepID=UPI00036396C8|nr:ABC transporter permease subunit [Effusibacillus pohliae]
MSVFGALVQNSLKLRKHRPERWRYAWRAYLALAIVLGLGWYTWALLHGNVTSPFFFWYLPALVFVGFWTGYSQIKREWRGGTAGWWLSLPYPRHWLLGAKLVAAGIRYLLVLVIGYVSTLILFFEGIWLQPNVWNGQMLLFTAVTLVKLLLFLLLGGPFFLTFGLALGVLQQTSWKVISPLFWLLYIAVANVLMWKTFSSLNLDVNKADRSGFWMFVSGLVPQLHDIVTLSILMLLASLVLGGLLFWFATRLLERHAEV